MMTLDGGRIGVVDQRQEKMFEGRVFLPTLVGEVQGLMQCLFEATGEGRHVMNLTSFP